MTAGFAGAIGRVVGRVAGAPYLVRWLVMAPCIGALSGALVIVFWLALLACTHLLLSGVAGYHAPTTARQGLEPGSPSLSRPWAIPLVVAFGALAGSSLVARFAPGESEGNGTDAAIEKCHLDPSGIRVRAVVVRILASALTLGSGGSSGLAGPSGHIGAGAGSWICRRAGLRGEDARIAAAIGLGAGIGAVLGAPIGGAVLGPELLYRNGIETRALYPSVLASAAAFAVFGGAEGYGPIFGHVADHVHPGALVLFGVIGVIAGFVGLFYAKAFYAISAVFDGSPLPRWLRPAVGGALVGLIAIEIPQVLGPGLGIVQRGLDTGLAATPLWIVLVLPFARTLSTGLSIGSGGSGGVFAPGLVIGAAIGTGVWRLLGSHVGSVGHSPAPYVVAGMMATLGPISRAPVGVMLLVAQMTGGYWILLPALLAVVPAWVIVQASGDTLYRSQLPRRIRT